MDLSGQIKSSICAYVLNLSPLYVNNIQQIRTIFYINDNLFKSVNNVGNCVSFCSQNQDLFSKNKTRINATFLMTLEIC